MRPVRLIIFTKAAQPGFSKTRLIPALGKRGAAKLAEKMLMHTLNESVKADVGPVEMCVTPPPTEPVWKDFAIINKLKLSAQGNGDLGERLSRVTKRIVENGESIIIIGTDCIELTAIHLKQALNSLRYFDSILIPAIDGGYVLLGLNFFHPSIFESVKWSTNTTCNDTINQLRKLGRTVQSFPSLRDIDEPMDLQFIPSMWKKGVRYAD